MHSIISVKGWREGIFENVPAAMDRIIDEMMERNRGRKMSRGEFIRGMGDVYGRALERSLSDEDLF